MRSRIAVSIALALSLVALASPAAAEVYEVGDGQAYTSIGAVPWESLEPGDEVRIHWRAAAYQEKWVIGRRGSEAAPIVVRGVAGPGGERPVIDGRDATTRGELDFTNEARGVIKIGSSNVPEDTLPAWIVIEGLEIRSGRPPFGFTGGDGAGSYADNAAAIYIEKGEDITIRDCVLHDSGNGLFVGAYDGETQRIRIERNWIHGNGIEDSIYEHNSYTAAIDIVFEGNHYGPLRAGCLGNNLKDRSAGLVVRANWIESGNRQLDLVDAEDSAVLVEHPSYGETFVLGNVLVEHEGDGNSQIIHYGGDSGTESDYRKGTLHLYGNTIVSTREGNTTLLRLSTNDESADVRDNVVVVTAGADRLAMLSELGALALRHNCMPDGWVDSHDVLGGTIDDDGSGIGSDPGLVDLDGLDLRLTEGSPCRDAAAPLADGVPPLNVQYVPHQAVEPRPSDGALDIGAFEHCEPGACAVVEPDAGTPGDDDDDDGGGDDDDDDDGGAPLGGDGGGCCRASPGRGLAADALLALAALLALRPRRRAARPGCTPRAGRAPRPGRAPRAGGAPRPGGAPRAGGAARPGRAPRLPV